MEYPHHSWPHKNILPEQCCQCGIIKKLEKVTWGNGYRTVYQKLDGTVLNKAGKCDDKLLYAMKPQLAKQLQLQLNQNTDANRHH